MQNACQEVRARNQDVCYVRKYIIEYPIFKIKAQTGYEIPRHSEIYQ